MQIYRQHTNYLQKCFACGRVGHDMYIVTVKGQQYIVCSAAHAESVEKETEKEAPLDGPESS